MRREGEAIAWRDAVILVQGDRLRLRYPEQIVFRARWVPSIRGSDRPGPGLPIMIDPIGCACPCC